MFAAVAAGLIIYTFAWRNYGLNFYDEGIWTYGGWRVSLGDKPLADFWALYGPGHVLILGALFKAFGTKLTVVRLWEAIAFVGVGALSWAVAAQILPRRPIRSFLIGTVTVVWLVTGSFNFSGTPTFSSVLLFDRACILFLILALKSQRLPLFAAAGFSGGLAVVVRQERIVYLLVPVVAAIAVHVFRVRTAKARTKNLVGVGILGLGAMVPIGLALLWLTASLSPSQIWDALVKFPATLGATREIPFPRLFPVTLRDWIFDQLIYYLPAAVLVATLPMLVRNLRSKDGIDELYLGSCAVLLWLYTLASYEYVRVRSDFPHLVPPVAAALLLVSLLFQDSPGKAGTAKRVAWVPNAAAFAFLALAMTVAISIRVSQLSRYEGGTVIGDGVAEGIVMDPGTVVLMGEVAETIDSQTVPFSPIFVTGARNDQVTVSHVIWYFLAQRKAATYYQEPHPGLTTTESVQLEIIEDLEESRVQLIVQSPNYDLGCAEPNLSCSPGSKRLDAYLRENFEASQTRGWVTLLTRKT